MVLRQLDNQWRAVSACESPHLPRACYHARASCAEERKSAETLLCSITVLVVDETRKPLKRKASKHSLVAIA